MRRRRTIGLLGLILAGCTAIFAAQQQSDGAAVRTTILGRHPTLIAVDDRSTRAFVLDEGGLARNSGGFVGGSVSTLDARTGAVLRTVQVGTGPDAVAVDEHTGRVFVLNSYMHNGGEGTVTMLDARSGQALRVTQVGDQPFGMALDRARDRVVVLNQNAISVLDAKSGLVTDSIGLGVAAQPRTQQTFAIALDDNGHAFASIGDANGATVTMLDTRLWTIMARQPTDHSLDDIAVDAATERAFVDDPKGILVLDATNGQLMRVNRNVGGAMAVDEHTGRVFIAEQQWSAAQGAPNWGRTDSGILYVLDARTGAVLHTLPIEWPDSLAVDAATGHILISHAGPQRSDGTFYGAGHLDIRDGQTGRLLRTIAVGVAPGAIAVDGRTRQALVVNQGGQIEVRDGWGWMPPWLRQRMPLLPPASAPAHAIPSSISLIPLGV